jgi:Ca2+-binding RTX toxin-like protein
MNTQLNRLLRQAISQATAKIQQFAQKTDFIEQLQMAFGDSFDLNIALGIRRQLRSGDFSLLPEIEVLRNGELGTANGAYAAFQDQIFISSDFLSRQQGNVNTIAELLLEEIGHKLDRLLNGNVDTPGDEGAIFRLLATGKTLSPQTLAGLRATDDRAVITVNGRSVAIETQDFYSDGGDNTLIGTSGNDYFSSGTGANTIDGGGGNDFLSIGFNNEDTDNTTITYTNINAGTITGGSNKGTKFKNIESVSFTTGSGNDVINISATTGDSTINAGNGNNTVTGGNGNDILIVGGDGNDTISGGKGNDNIFIFTGIGADTIDGGGGNDSLSISFNNGDTDNTTITYTNVSAGTITGGSNNGTKFKNIESVSFTTGSGNDVINISATTDDSTINAGNGNNTVTGGNGNDIIGGGEGNDTISGGKGNDNLFTGTGVDTVNGGAGIDRLNIFNNEDTDNTIITYTNVNAGTITGGSNNGTKFKNIESVSFTTGSGNDVINISATTGDSTINAGDGNDTVTSGAGNDNIFTGTGADIVDGGGGNDSLSISFNYGDTDNTLITYTNVNAGLITGGSNNGTKFKNIESVSFTTGSGNDVINISATTGGSTINAGDGNNTVTGGAGNDNILAKAGNNTVIGGAGDDLIRTGNGTNTVTGGAGNDTIFTGTGDDIINGGAGNDTIYAGAGNNTISGGNDDDVYYINATIDIGTTTIRETTTGGFDTLDFSTRSATPVNVDLSLTTIQTVAPNLQLVIPVISLENVSGTIGNDTLTGNSLNNTLIGNAGDDLLTGGAGSDRFVFSGSNLFVSSNAITAQLGKDTITDFTTGEDKIVLSKFNFSAITNDIGTAIGANFAIVADDNTAFSSTLAAAIIYSQSSGNLFYNQDGAWGGLGRGGVFATLTGIPTLAAGDFSIVD